MKKQILLLLALIHAFGIISICGHFPATLDSQMQCGRESWKKIYVCDPDKILGPRDLEASQLDVIIAKIANQSTCPCSSYTCSKGVGGYKVAVAIAKQMFDDETNNDEEDIYDPKENMRNKITIKLKEASKIGDRLRKNWKLGACEEDVILLYSQNDQVVYTVNGEVAGKKLTRDLIEEITERAIKYGFSRSPFDGIHSILNDYKAVFLGSYFSRTPRSGHSLGNGAPLTRRASSSLLLLLLPLSLLASSFCFSRS